MLSVEETENERESPRVFHCILLDNMLLESRHPYNKSWNLIPTIEYIHAPPNFFDMHSMFVCVWDIWVVGWVSEWLDPGNGFCRKVLLVEVLSGFQSLSPFCWLQLRNDIEKVRMEILRVHDPPHVTSGERKNTLLLLLIMFHSYDVIKMGIRGIQEGYQPLP